MKVLVIGGANIDIKCHIEGAAVLATSNPGQIRLSAGGVGRNIAHNLALLGCEAHLLTAMADDVHGLMLRDTCSRAHIHLHAVTSDYATGTYTAILDATGDLVIGVAAMQAIETLTPDRLDQSLPPFTHLDAIIADANLPQESVSFLAEWAAYHAIDFAFEPVSVAKCTRINAVLAQHPVYLMSPNRAQLAILTGQSSLNNEDLLPACAQLHAGGVQNIIVGLGSAGAFWSDGETFGFVSALTHEIIDATGGGDAALAAALWALKRGDPLEAAAKAGQRAAALTVTCAASVYPHLSSQLIETEVP